MENIKNLLTVSDEAIQHMEKLVSQNCDREITKQEILESDLRFIKEVREIDAIRASSRSRASRKVII